MHAAPEKWAKFAHPEGEEALLAASFLRGQRSDYLRVIRGLAGVEAGRHRSLAGADMLLQISG